MVWRIFQKINNSQHDRAFKNAVPPAMSSQRRQAELGEGAATHSTPNMGRKHFLNRTAMMASSLSPPSLSSSLSVSSFPSSSSAPLSSSLSTSAVPRIGRRRSRSEPAPFDEEAVRLIQQQEELERLQIKEDDENAIGNEKQDSSHNNRLTENGTWHRYKEDASSPRSSFSSANQAGVFDRFSMISKTLTKAVQLVTLMQGHLDYCKEQLDSTAITDSELKRLFAELSEALQMLRKHQAGDQRRSSAGLRASEPLGTTTRHPHHEDDYAETEERWRKEAHREWAELSARIRQFRTELEDGGMSDSELVESVRRMSSAAAKLQQNGSATPPLSPPTTTTTTASKSHIIGWTRRRVTEEKSASAPPPMVQPTDRADADDNVGDDDDDDDGKALAS